MAEPIDSTALRDAIVERALAGGAIRCGVTDISAPARYDIYESWLARGDHGEMAYMADDFHRRARFDAKELLPSARSAIVVAYAYARPPTPSADREGARGEIAAYALGDDYHHVLRDRLESLASDIRDLVSTRCEHRACVDSAPVLERELAERAGLGFVGKNTMLISPGAGSYTLLGVLLSSLEIASSEAPGRQSGCGTCTACLDACPTKAFREAYELDARRCISYLTIESRGPIAQDLREAVGTRVFGCDACQSVCPYNAVAPDRQEVLTALRPRDEERAHPRLSMLAGLGSNGHKRFVKHSAMRRNTRQQLRRNLALALGNAAALSSADHDALQSLRTDADATVREQAEWSTRQQALTTTSDLSADE